MFDLEPGLPEATALGTFPIETKENQYADGLYLRADEDQLIVTGSSHGRYGWDFWFSPLAWMQAESSVVSVDVSDPQAPQQTARIELDGEIISSRRIDNVLYLATRFQPFLPGLETYDPNTPTAARQLERIDNTPLSTLLPRYRVANVSGSRALVNPQDCYLPTEDAPVRSADVISMIAIDLDVMDVVSSVCFVGATETLYVSLESAYVATTRWEYQLQPGPFGPVSDFYEQDIETDLHKFSLTDGLIRYEASGSVDGHLGWNTERKPFRLSEKGSDLRAITYTAELTPDSSPVAVTVLRDTGDDELQVLARLPNAARPEPIGKPGEQLYATRFVGDRAYLVTFRMTDPLYVVDFTQPHDPFVAGELEITGYSDYLHPLQGGFLLGVGKDAIPDPNGDFRGAWYQGVKVSLYNVQDPQDPFEADSLVIGKRGTETPVLRNHRPPSRSYQPAPMASRRALRLESMSEIGRCQDRGCRNPGTSTTGPSPVSSFFRSTLWGASSCPRGA